MPRLLPPLLFALLAILGACHPSGHATPPNDAQIDPTLGICRPAPSPTVDTDAALGLAADALHRGCVREAGIHIDALATKVDNLEGPTRTRLILLAGHALSAAFEYGYDGHGYWMPSVDQLRKPPPFAARLFPRTRDILATVYDALAVGDLPSDVRADGRILDIFARIGFVSCLQVSSAQARDAQNLAAFHNLVFTLKTVYPVQPVDKLTEPGPLLAVARASGAACSSMDAANYARLAAVSYRRQRDEANAQIAELFAIEVTAFPGGRATELAMRVHDPDAAGEAAEHLAAATGAGPRHAAGQALERELVKWSTVHRAATTEIAARVLWLRAAGALVLRAEPETALALATDLHDVAMKARRADLLDASRVITTFAAVALGQWELVDQTLLLLDASLTVRGQSGAYQSLIRQLINQSNILSNLGRGSDGLRLLAAGRLLAHAAPEDVLISRTHSIGMLTRIGRFEEAFAELESTLSFLQKHRNDLSASVYDSVHGQIRSFREVLLGLMGRYDEVLDGIISQHPRARRLFRAILHGDIARLNLLVTESESDEETLLIRGLMLQAGYCRDNLAAARPLYEAIAAAGALATSPASMDQATQATNTDSIAATGFGNIKMTYTIADCGASLGDPQIVALADQFRRNLYIGANDPVLSAYLSAATTEAQHDYATAARLYLDIGHNLLDRTGAVASGAVGRFQTMGHFYQRAAVAALRASPPFVAFALVALEDSRARALRTLRASRKQPSRTSLRPLEALETKLSQLQARRRSYTALQASTPDAASRAAITAQAAKIDTEIDRGEIERKTLIRRIADTEPAAYQVAALAPPPSIPEMQVRLRPDESLVYFIVGPERAFAIVIDARDVRTITLPVNDNVGSPALQFNIDRLKYLLSLRTGSATRGLTLDDGTPVDERTAALDEEIEVLRDAVYQRLIQPLHAVIPTGQRVIIVPDTATTSLPFAALGTRAAPWIARNPIRVLPSAHMLEPPAPTRSPAGHPLVVGDPDFGATPTRSPRPKGSLTATNARFTALPGTRIEAQDVARLYRTTPLIGSRATEEALLRLIGAASVIHIASHGIAQASDPDRSALVLALPAKRSDSDGILYSYEVERLTLSAELVVLSACETGRGQARGTEGILALDRAFLLAGAKAVVSSQWLVPDGATATLMSAFHRRIFAGEPADVALAHAMLEVQQEPGWEHPRYWSGFRVVGAGLR